MDPAKYSAIPTAIWAYYKKLLAKNLKHPVVKAINTQGEALTWRAFNDLFCVTSANTGLAPDKLLSELGFDENNLDNNHLQSIFGVMRAINMLDGLGFRSITPLPSKRSRRECDLSAEYTGIRFAIEVFRSSEVVYRFPDHQDPVHCLQSYIAHRYQDKRPQFEATMKVHNCSKALLTVVMDSSPAKQLTSSDEWIDIVRDTYQLMGNPSDTHLLLFTGLQDSRTDTNEHAVFPELAC